MPAEHPVPHPVDAVVATGTTGVDATVDDVLETPMDVVVLVVPDQRSLSHEFVDAIADVRRRGDAAVLVVFPRVVDAGVILEAQAAGASHCVIAPSSEDLFKHIERARALRRRAVMEADPLDHTLDTLWRARTHHD